MKCNKKKIFLDFYKLDTTGKHSSINQLLVCVTVLSKTGGKNSSDDARRTMKSYNDYILVEKFVKAFM